MLLYLFFDYLMSTCARKNENSKMAKGLRLSPIPKN